MVMAWRLEQLRSEWGRLTGPFGAGAGPGEERFVDLARRYSEPGRFYHNLVHLGEVLARIKSLRDLARSPEAVELAAWFHDAVYDPRAADNEEKSAALAGEALRRLLVPPEMVQATKALILRTKDHRATAEDVDSHILLDADLAILGESEPRYDEYAGAIRREYAWVSEPQYRSGRKRVLEGFLGRGRIYLTDRMHVALDARARQNLAREIASLAEG